MIKIIIKLLAWVAAFVVVFIMITNIWVVVSTRDQVFSLAELKNPAATLLVLGTSHKTMAGNDNLFFKERMDMAYRLYSDDLVKTMVLSGDHQGKYYNEPLAMRNSLIEMGVPDTILIADDGGVRTLDSVVRCKQLFGVDSVIIITQKFHAYRALFISNYYNLPAIVVFTNPVTNSEKFWVVLREVLARPLAVLDLYVFHRKPEFDRVKIN